jgi:hypothetical protein
VEEVGLGNERRWRKVPFQATNIVKEFEAAYLQNASVVPSMPNMNRTQWLQNSIIWEPVDGQHIVAACAQARRENEVELLSDEDFLTRYARRKAKFIVFDNLKLYIEASVMINAKEFERKFYTTMYEDMVMLRAILACGKPNLEVRADDSKRADAITLSASALHWTIPFVGKSLSLGSLSKWMVEYTRHAWQEDDACYDATLQICKDYEEDMLWYSEADQKKW